MESNLRRLIEMMQPQLHPDPYVFVTQDSSAEVSYGDVLCSFKEEEGITLILQKPIADQYSFDYNYEAAWITLSVQSDLDAVGFTAYFSRLLGDAGISCNVVAAYYHDHIFVPWELGEKATEILKNSSSLLS
ncbi:MAG: ACT domain-containing protein [Bacteroidota bacterium]